MKQSTQLSKGIFILLITGLFFLMNLVNISLAKSHQLTGISSYYAHYHHGKLTANGETFNMYANTAAHKTLPLGSVIKVTNTRNGKFVTVKINDRGPYIKGRILDVSLGVARKLDMIKTGTAPVKIKVLKVPKKFVYHHNNAKRYLKRRRHK